jgi:hypothetical protein
MDELWTVLIDCKLAKETKGTRGNMLDLRRFRDFIILNELTDVLQLDMKDKVHVLRVGVYSSTTNTTDYSATSQWRSDKRPPRPLRNVAKKFRDDAKEFLDMKKLEKEKSVHKKSAPPTIPSHTSLPCCCTSSASPPPAGAHHQNLKDFLYKILASPPPTDVMEHKSFFKDGISLDKLQSMFVDASFETCELERKKILEANDDSIKKEQAVSVAVDIKHFEEVVDPSQFPTLVSKNISISSDKDIKAVIRDIVKLSKQVKSVDLLKCLNYNDTTTSLVEVPCSARQSGFKKQARRSNWVLRILECVRRYKEEELLVNDGDDKEDHDEIAYKDDDAARWLITYLGEWFPSEFVKSAQALDMPIHKGKMAAEYTTAMWSDAGVGVAAQRIIMKYFIGFFGYKFTVPEASINQLAVDSVPPVVGTIEYMDRTLDYLEARNLFDSNREMYSDTNPDYRYKCIHLIQL